MTESKKNDVITIKKYANRRLYDMSQSQYVTLEDLCVMVKNGDNFTVIDAKNGHDLTRSVLTQIIFEQESKGSNLLPIGFLRQIIGFYDDNLGAVLPSYLETTMQNFSENQDKIREYISTAEGFSPLKQLEKINQQNVEWLEKTWNMMSPFSFSSFDKKEDD